MTWVASLIPALGLGEMIFVGLGATCLLLLTISATLAAWRYFSPIAPSLTEDIGGGIMSSDGFGPDWYQDKSRPEAIVALSQMAESHRIMSGVQPEKSASRAQTHLCLALSSSPLWPEPQPITDAQKNGSLILGWHAMHNAWLPVCYTWGDCWRLHIAISGNPVDVVFPPNAITHYLPVPPDVKD